MVVDLREPVHRLKGMRALRDESVLARAAKGEGGHRIAWPGEIDMSAIQEVAVLVDAEAPIGSGKCRSSRTGIWMPWSSSAGCSAASPEREQLGMSGHGRKLRIAVPRSMDPGGQ
jgi:hypothetical protein